MKIRTSCLVCRFNSIKSALKLLLVPAPPSPVIFLGEHNWLLVYVTVPLLRAS